MRIIVIVLFSILISNVSSQLNFLVVGDWGGTSSPPYTTQTQLEVAAAMGQIGSIYSSSFVVSVGDNFYDNGIVDADDIRFLETFEKVYTQPELQKWYIVAGNRDHYGNVDGEIAYAQKPGSRWYFPSLSYDVVVPIPNSNATIHFIFLDTWDLTSDSRSNGGSPPNQIKAAEDLALLEGALNHSVSTWTIVVSHYTIWSAGAHGPSNKDLRLSVEPLLLKYKPDLYLCGHDHSQQHVQVNGMNYYVVGGGSEVNNNFDNEQKLPSGALKFKFPNAKSDGGGFAGIKVTPTELTVEFYDTKSTSPKYQNVHYPISRSNVPVVPRPNVPTPPVTIIPLTRPEENSQFSEPLIGGIRQSTFTIILVVVGLSSVVIVILVIALLCKYKNKNEEEE